MRPPGRRVLHRIVHQQQQQPPQCRIVGVHINRLIGSLGRNFELPLLGQNLPLLANVAHQRRQLHAIQRQRRQSRIGARQQQQILDQPRQFGPNRR